MSQASPHVYIVLVNWHGWRDTIECLESVLRMDYQNFTVLVADNASADQSVENIVQWASGAGPTVRSNNRTLAHWVEPGIAKPVGLAVLEPAESASSDRVPEGVRVVVLRTGANLGFAGGNNVGMRFAARCGRDDYIWLLNNDTVVEPQALTELVQRAQAADNQGIVGSTLIFHGEPDKIQAMGGARFNSRRALGAPIGCFRSPDAITDDDAVAAERDAAYVVGASMLVPRAFIDDVGLMCDDYFLYFEEMDWLTRGRKLGYRCLYAPRSRVYHKIGASVARGRSNTVPVGVQYGYRNRLRFTKRFFPGDLLAVRLRVFLEGLQDCSQGRPAEGFFAMKTALGRVVV